MRNCRPFISTSALRPSCSTFLTVRGPVHLSCSSLLPLPLRCRVLSASFTSTRSPGHAVAPADGFAIFALTFSRVAILCSCLFSRTCLTSRRTWRRCSMKLSRPPVIFESSIYGTRVSSDVRGLRPNRISKGDILPGKVGSGIVRLIQHAGDTYSSHRSGQGTHSSDETSCIHPLVVLLLLDLVGDLLARTGCPPSTICTDVECTEPRTLQTLGTVAIRGALPPPLASRGAGKRRGI